jgi:hypothetical protein
MPLYLELLGRMILLCTVDFSFCSCCMDMSGKLASVMEEVIDVDINLHPRAVQLLPRTVVVLIEYI